MALFLQKDEGELVTELDAIDLGRGSFSESLSSSNLDDDDRFHVTFDRILFKSPNEIVSQVLDANGYRVNLENILACFDSFIFGLKVTGKRLPDERIAVKSYLPCIQFKLPKKAKVGFILKKFYAEIESYQSKIEGLEKNQKNGPKKKDPEKLQKTIERLEEENKELKSNLNQLRSQINQLTKAEANANKALISQNIMPPNIRLATVRDIDLKERSIVLKAGRTTINFPIFLSTIMPEIGDKSLVYMEEGQVLGGFFYESKGKPITPCIATVLWAENGCCKIRDHKRRVWLMNYRNEREKEIFNSLRRHDKVLLYMVEGTIIRVENLLQDQGGNFQEKYKENLALHQLLDFDRQV